MDREPLFAFLFKGLPVPDVPRELRSKIHYVNVYLHSVIKGLGITGDARDIFEKEIQNISNSAHTFFEKANLIAIIQEKNQRYVHIDSIVSILAKSEYDLVIIMLVKNLLEYLKKPESLSLVILLMLDDSEESPDLAENFHSMIPQDYHMDHKQRSGKSILDTFRDALEEILSLFKEQ
jgi:primosomal protein N'